MSPRRTVGAVALVMVAATSVAYAVDAGDSDPGHYTVAAGDTWASIAAAHAVTADGLQVANGTSVATADTTHPMTGRIIHVPEAVAVPPAPSTTTTVPPPTTVRPTTTVPPATTVAIPTTTAPPAGTFVEGFAGLEAWTFAHRRYDLDGGIDPRSTASVVNGRAQIAGYDQNYGDATLRSAVRYDLTNGGTVSLDMGDDARGDWLLGFAYITFSANPNDAAASMADERDIAYSAVSMPANALQIQLRDNCKVPWAPPVAVRYDVAAPGGRTTQRGTCAAAPDGRWRFVFTAGHVSVRNGAGAEVVAYDVTVPPTGWVILGVHNHASEKYSVPVGSIRAVTGTFDNVTYPRAR
ncbi:MAG: LysM peptidoglycan-binding domain-containing protein [Ilumatobacteraceae bacterium]